MARRDNSTDTNNETNTDGSNETPSSSTPAATPTTASNLADAFSASGFLDDLSGLFTSTVSDITDPRFQEIIAGLATDAASVAVMRITAATPEEVALAKDAQASLTARGQTALQIPGLIAANKQAAFLTTLGKATNTLVGFGVSLLRSYIPAIPNLTTLLR